MLVPDAAQRVAKRSGALLIRDRDESGMIPGLQRTTSCCAAPGKS